MTLSEPTWAVVATVDEPLAVVQTFVAWHLSLGAAHVYLYCDRPNDPVQAAVAHLPQVSVVICDDAHWLRIGKSRPRRHQVRQVANARDAYGRTDADWLVHIDADEFLWSHAPVTQQLSAVSETTDCLIIPVAERVHLEGAQNETIFEGAFRRPFVSSITKGRAVFGPDYSMTYKGLAGHAQGKVFVRTGRPLRLSIHRARSTDPECELGSERADCDQLELLHFDGLTSLQWTFKLARMAHALVKKGGMPLQCIAENRRMHCLLILIRLTKSTIGLRQRMKSNKLCCRPMIYGPPLHSTLCHPCSNGFQIKKSILRQLPLMTGCAEKSGISSRS